MLEKYSLTVIADKEHNINPYLSSLHVMHKHIYVIIINGRTNLQLSELFNYPNTCFNSTDHRGSDK